MSLPNSADFALIEIQTAAGPPATYAKLCGIENVNINRTVNTNKTFRRDCDKPNRPGVPKVRVTGKEWTISGSGSDNIDIETTYADAEGVRKVYKVSLYEDDGTDSGELMGSYSGTAMMTARNQGYSQDSAGSIEITLEGEGDLTWTPVT